MGLQSRSPGRPRNEQARQAVFKAALELLEESHSLACVTIEGIAARAGVGKPTIYRWWPNKAAVLMDAFLAETAPRLPYPPGVPPAEALRQQIGLVVEAFLGRTGHILSAIIAAAQTDPEIGEAFRTRFLAQRRTEAEAVIERGIKDGSFAPDLNIEVAIDLLYGPIYFRLLVGHGKLDRTFANCLADLGISALSRI